MSTRVIVLGGAASVFPPSTEQVSCTIDESHTVAAGQSPVTALPDMFVPSAVSGLTMLDLPSGNSQIVPANGVSIVMLMPPAGNTTAISIAGDAGDVGTALHPAAPAVFYMRGTFWLKTGGAIDGFGIAFA